MPLRKPWYSKNNTYGKIRAAAEAVAQNPNNNKLKNNLRNLVVRVALGNNSTSSNATAPAVNKYKNMSTDNLAKAASRGNLSVNNKKSIRAAINAKLPTLNSNGTNAAILVQALRNLGNNSSNAAAANAAKKNNNAAGAGNKNGVTIGRFRKSNKNGLIGKAKVGNSIRNVYRQAGNYFATVPNSTNVYRHIVPVGRFPSFSRQFKYVNNTVNLFKTNNGRIIPKNLIPPGFGPPPAPSSKNAKVNAFKTWWATQTARGVNTNTRARNYVGQGKTSPIWIPANAKIMRAAAANNKNFWAAVNKLNAIQVPNPENANAAARAEAEAAASAQRKANANRLAAATAAANAERVAMSKKLTEWLYNKQLRNRDQPVKWAGNFMSNQNYSSFRNRNMNVNYTGKYISVSKGNRNAFWNAVNKLKTAVNTANANAAEAHPLPRQVGNNNGLESHPSEENWEN